MSHAAADAWRERPVATECGRGRRGPDMLSRPGRRPLLRRGSPRPGLQRPPSLRGRIPTPPPTVAITIAPAVAQPLRESIDRARYIARASDHPAANADASDDASHIRHEGRLGARVRQQQLLVIAAAVVGGPVAGDADAPPQATASDVQVGRFAAGGVLRDTLQSRQRGGCLPAASDASAGAAAGQRTGRARDGGAWIGLDRSRGHQPIVPGPPLNGPTTSGVIHPP